MELLKVLASLMPFMIFVFHLKFTPMKPIDRQKWKLSQNGKKPGKHKPNSANDKAATNQNQTYAANNTDVPINVHVHLPPSLGKQNGLYDEKKETRDKIKVAVEIVAAALVFVYASITGYQAWMTRDFFERNQRPYVSSVDVSPAATATLPDQARILVGTIDYQNYGKSPAMHLSHDERIFSDKDPLQSAYTWFEGMGSKPLPSYSDYKTPYGKDLNKFFGHDYILMMNEKGGTSVNTITHATTVDAPYVIAIRIQYFDSFGNRYWTDNC